MSLGSAETVAPGVPSDVGEGAGVFQHDAAGQPHLYAEEIRVRVPAAELGGEARHDQHLARRRSVGGHEVHPAVAEGPGRDFRRVGRQLVKAADALRAEEPHGFFP